MIDTYARGWVCPPIYIIPYLDKVDVCPEGEDHVFDGAHKLEAIFAFMDNKFPLKYDNLKSAFLGEYNGKHFADLPRDIQERIRKYKFNINIVDKDTASNEDLLHILWERVNKSGKPVNTHELNIPVTRPYMEGVITPNLAHFLKTTIFPKTESKRGALEGKLETILAINMYNQPDKFGSLPSLVKDWYATHLGETMEKRVEAVQVHSAEWSETLVRASKVLKDLEQLNTFCDDDGNSILAEAHRTDLVLVLGRTVRFFPRIEDFRSQKKVIADRLKADIFSKDSYALVHAFGMKGRNGAFWRRMISYIDAFLTEIVATVQPRLFTRVQKEERLRAQGGRCLGCSKKILAHHLHDGDHIVEWCQGGETTMENLQILHRHCHQEKEKA